MLRHRRPSTGSTQQLQLYLFDDQTRIRNNTEVAYLFNQDRTQYRSDLSL